MKNILITGTAGFIGFYLAKTLLDTEKNISIVGIDNINDYYDVSLKYARLNECGIKKEDIQYNEYTTSSIYPQYKFSKIDISDYAALNELFEKESFDLVINLAAQAGVRYSIENPQAYIQSNIVGFTNILECCRYHNIKHLIYASSSSVYGINNQIPFREDANVDYPASLYAATKKSNELMAHTYSHLYNIPTTGLRFFTVYGPWGRPDMAPILFAKAMLEGRPIKVFNEGNMLRDFTYIADIVNAMILLIKKPVDKQNLYQLFNIGCSTPVNLLDFIKVMEKELNLKAQLEMYPMQPGDVKETYADTSKLEKYIHYKPQTKLEDGIAHFAKWIRSYS